MTRRYCGACREYHDRADFIQAWPEDNRISLGRLAALCIVGLLVWAAIALGILALALQGWPK